MTINHQYTQLNKSFLLPHAQNALWAHFPIRPASWATDRATNPLVSFPHRSHPKRRPWLMSATYRETQKSVVKRLGESTLSCVQIVSTANLLTQCMIIFFLATSPRLLGETCPVVLCICKSRLGSLQCPFTAPTPHSFPMALLSQSKPHAD